MCVCVRTAHIRFAAGASRQDVDTVKQDALTRRLSAALLQPPGCPAPLAEQVATLLAVQRGLADWLEPDQVTYFPNTVHSIRIRYVSS